jgi:hypothetical protein
MMEGGREKKSREEWSREGKSKARERPKQRERKSD